MSKTIEKKADNKNGVKRMLFAAICILIEFGFWFAIFIFFNSYANWVYLVFRIAALLLSLWLYSQKLTSSIKMLWILIILTVPLFGIFLYFMVGNSRQTKTMKKRYKAVDDTILPLLPRNTGAFEELKQDNRDASAIASYIIRNSQYPVYNDSDVIYFNSAEKGLEAQLEELSKAEKFIFMEYHAIENAESWKRIESVLLDRVKAGVDVRIFYDDLGSIGFVDMSFAKELSAKGIACRVFNPFVPGLNMFLNNRDHRKITVIDGKVGFVGGYNLANEYFNVTHPYGMWKDTGIKITGPAVKSLTITFFEMWDATSDKNSVTVKSDYKKFLPDFPYKKKEPSAYIIPYASKPLTTVHIGEDVYINILNKANEYCYFVTPYLILSDELTNAITTASQRGVDVRIITPGIPDKKTIYSITRSFYYPLVKCGVRIFEWTPGFCHAKMCVADDKMATVGTINLDYRSLYHHFENGCFFCNCQAVLDEKADFLNTLKECREVTKQYDRNSISIFQLKELILRLFAGLL